MTLRQGQARARRVGESVGLRGGLLVVDDDGAAAAVRGIRRVFDDIVAGGLRAEMVVGASDEEIDAMAAAQGVRMVPAAVREILRILGDKPGPWFTGSFFGLDLAHAQVKEHALWCLEEADERGFAHEMRDPEGLLVILDAAASSYLVIDGVDLAEPDPPVWLLTEGGEVTRRVESVTAWFARASEGVMRLRRLCAERRARDRSVPPLAKYFRW